MKRNHEVDSESQKVNQFPLKVKLNLEPKVQKPDAEQSPECSEVASNNRSGSNNLVVNNPYSSELEENVGGFYNARRGFNIKGYIGKKPIGRGTQSLVWLVKKDEDYGAIKFSKSTTFLIKVALDEVQILKKLNAKSKNGHPNIVKLLEHGFLSADNALYCFMILELLGPFLFFALHHSQTEMHMENKKKICRQVLSALSYVHRNSVIHCDVKPENIMLVISKEDARCQANNEKIDTATFQIDLTDPFFDVQVKLGDFGSARSRENDRYFKELQTCLYRAPETFLTTKIDTPVDIWSFGRMAYQLVFKHRLFSCNMDNNEHNLKHLNMMSSVLGPIPLAPFRENLRPEYVNFFDDSGNFIDLGCVPARQNFLEMAAMHKLNVADALELDDFLRSLLKYEPSHRSTAEQALSHAFLKTNNVRASQIKPNTQRATSQ
uniref:Protein kinase domain-containing protein n=1 Tax=Caenorhabditis tropicalis TaxID=1561998 RepID=A0A1I7U1X9_9PELO